jgi:DNA-binding transcriptional ArsR family regulator
MLVMIKMMSKEYDLKLESRRKIYNFISKNPGLHLREISRKTNIPISSLRYHLNYLVKIGIVDSKKDYGYVRYYIKTSVGKRDKEILNLLRQDIPRKIIIMLLIPGPSYVFKDKETKKKAYFNGSAFQKTYSKKELVELTKYWKGKYDNDFYIKKHRTTINFHLNKLLEADIIEKITVGKETKYKLKNDDLFWQIFVKYQDELSIRSIRTLMIWQSNGLGLITDKILNVIYEIFPNPYYG